MYLSDLVGKRILVKNNEKGICLGIGVSLTSHAVKYLFCASERATNRQADFAVSISAVEEFGEDVVLSALRPVYPRSCAKFFLNLPVYSVFGETLGVLLDAQLENNCVEYLFTDENERYPLSAVSACVDALILKKPQPYPIGQRIPAHSDFRKQGKSNLITKPLLKRALKKGKLIELTLSLPPFSFRL